MADFAAAAGLVGLDVDLPAGLVDCGWASGSGVRSLAVTGIEAVVGRARRRRWRVGSDRGKRLGRRRFAGRPGAIPAIMAGAASLAAEALQ
ncbi:hypothetical protein GCM10009078_34150 [Cupriavidus gilardii]